jgi:hypothetical protein
MDRAFRTQNVPFQCGKKDKSTSERKEPVDLQDSQTHLKIRSSQN